MGSLRKGVEQAAQDVVTSWLIDEIEVMFGIHIWPRPLHLHQEVGSHEPDESG